MDRYATRRRPHLPRLSGPTHSFVAAHLGMAMLAAASGGLVAGVQPPVEPSATGVDDLIRLGDSLLAQGELEAALDAYRKVTELDPTATMAFRGAGFALLQMDRPEEAIPLLKDAIRLEPSAARPWENLGLAHSQIYDALVGELRELAFRRPSGELLADHPSLERGTELNEKLRQLDWRLEALRCLREAVRLEPAEAKYWYNLGTTLQQYRPQEAREITEALVRAVELDGSYYPALRNLAHAFKRQGWWREAREICLRAQRVTGVEDPWVPATLGDAAYELGDLEEAERSYAHELELNPRSIHAHMGLAILYQRQGALERSRAHKEAAVALDPEHEAIIRREIEASH